MDKIIIFLLLIIGTNVSANVRTFICISDPFSFELYIDVKNKIMRSNSYGRTQETLVFSERYILNTNYNQTGDIGGSHLLFDRYTGDLIIDFTFVNGFKERRSGLPTNNQIYKCNEKKI
jgi:hypothetical protein